MGVVRRRRRVARPGRGLDGARSPAAGPDQQPLGDGLRHDVGGRAWRRLVPRRHAGRQRARDRVRDGHRRDQGLLPRRRARALRHGALQPRPDRDDHARQDPAAAVQADGEDVHAGLRPARAVHGRRAAGDGSEQPDLLDPRRHLLAGAARFQEDRRGDGARQGDDRFRALGLPDVSDRRFRARRGAGRRAGARRSEPLAPRPHPGRHDARVRAPHGADVRGLADDRLLGVAAPVDGGHAPLGQRPRVHRDRARQPAAGRARRRRPRAALAGAHRDLAGAALQTPGWRDRAGLGDPGRGTAVAARGGPGAARHGLGAVYRLRRQALPLRLHHLRHGGEVGGALRRGLAAPVRGEEALGPGGHPGARVHPVRARQKPL